MARGGPDYIRNFYPVRATIAPSSVAEASRIFMVDNFDTPTLAWKDASSAGATVAITTSTCYSGFSSLRLLAPDGEGVGAGVSRNIPLPLSRKFGIEVVFGMDYQFDGVFIIRLDASLRTEYASAYLNYLADEGKLSIKGWPTTDVELSPSMKLTDYNRAFSRLKLAVDFSEFKYLYVDGHGTRYDVSSYDTTHITIAGDSMMAIALYAMNGDDNVGRNVYVDSVVVTEEIL